jgi:large subunit ribosomal protein L18e
MKSNTKIKKQLKKKTSPSVVETILEASKNKAWKKIAEVLSGSRRNHININLEEIDKYSKENKTLVIPGKVLSQGEVSKKMKIVSLNFSKSAEEKLIKSGCEVKTILQEIKLNPEAKDIEILSKK